MMHFGICLCVFFKKKHWKLLFHVRFNKRERKLGKEDNARVWVRNDADLKVVVVAVTLHEPFSFCHVPRALFTPVMGRNV